MKTLLKLTLGLIFTLSTLTTMAHFEPAYDKTGGHEGGHVFVASDYGLETINGISRKYHPDAKVWQYVDVVAKKLNIDNSQPVSGFHSKMIDKQLDKLPQFHEAVYQFYKRNYWDLMHLDLMPNQSVAEEMYDTGVNQGVHYASLYLQESLNLLSNNGNRYVKISEDGEVGSQTLGAVKSYFDSTRRYGSFSEKAIIKTLNGLQFQRYVKIVRSNPHQAINFLGWLKRV